jgi:hypothetical protein
MANWTLDELLAVREYIDSPNLSEDVCQRFAEVGGIVRHVYSDKYARVLKEQKDKVNELSMELLTNETLAQASLTSQGWAISYSRTM